MDTKASEKETKSINIALNKNAIIAAILNLILVGLGYIYMKQYPRAILSLIVYAVLYVLIFYLATFVPTIIWLGLPLTGFFVYDAYKRAEKSNTFLFG